MQIADFIESAITQTTETVKRFGVTDAFKVKFGEIFSDEKDHEETISGSVVIDFAYGNCMHEHTVNVGWNPIDGFGMENHDGEIFEFTFTGLLKSLYFDLALNSLEDKYLE